MAVARVVLVPPVARLAPYDYRVSEHLGSVVAGTRVLVPLGSRRSMGVVVEVGGVAAGGNELRDVIAVLDPEPVIDSALMDLLRWMADYYLSPLAETVATALPGSLRVETERVFVADEAAANAVVLDAAARALVGMLVAEGPLTAAALQRRVAGTTPSMLARLRRQGVVRVTERKRREVATTRRLRLYEAIGGRGPLESLAKRPALQTLYRYLLDHPLGRAPSSELRGSFANASAKVGELMRARLVRRREEESYRPVLPPAVSADRPVSLTAAQAEAVRAIADATRQGFVPFLLWGVTGSGKTEVYLRAIADVLPSGRSALVLVPEISLTHQLVDRLRARFGERVAVLHSQLSDGERWDEWRRIARGEATIIVGARSAVFAPMRRLGVVIVDEEHDGAYKQADGVRYQGRDVAVMRAKLAACPLILGSATPSMESFHNARTGRYRLLALPERVESRPLPSVEIVDLRRPDRSLTPPVGPDLMAALEANFAAGGQSLVFLNRRGFANFLQCRACGEAVMCPNCSVTLTWHQRWRALRCHYCDHTVPRPVRCGECGEAALETWGVGTEQLEGMLRGALPAARIARMDRDTTRRKGSQAALLHAWANRKLDVLIGTQMVTKGHDVPGVTLVGVILADLSLNFPDFRAAERTFQLLAQVGGRAGRGTEPGRVLIQTLQPHHYALRAAIAHDFAAFAVEEMAARRELDYPPFARLVMVRVEGEHAAEVEGLARHVARQLRELADGRFGVLGPAPAPLERLRRRHRWQILLRGRSGSVLRRAVVDVTDGLHAKARARALRLIVDVDPYSML